MRSELFRIQVEAGGVPLLGIGVLLLLWVVGWAAALAVALRRGASRGDLVGYAWPMLLGAAAIVVAPRFAPHGIPIRGYGVMLLAGISTGVAMATHRARSAGLDADTVLSLAFWLFVGGILGARALFVVEYWETSFAGKPPLETLVEVLRFTEGGLVVYGSLVGAAAAFLGFAWRHGIAPLATADLLAPALAAGLALGRIGCLLNGCCYGGPCERPWAVTFPRESPPYYDQLARGELQGVRVLESRRAEAGGPSLGVEAPIGAPPRRLYAINGHAVRSRDEAAAALIDAHRGGKTVEMSVGPALADGEKTVEIVRVAPTTRSRSLPVHPTQLYAAVNAGLLAWLLWSYYPHRRRAGEVILLLLTIYPVSRFLLEVIRVDEASFLGTGMSISQNVSVVVFVLAILGWVAVLRSPPRGGGDTARTAAAPAA